MQPDEKDKLPTNQEIPGDQGIEPIKEYSDQPKRRKVRVKIKKKIRIKQKPSAKKLVRKIAERAFWVIIIAGFIASLLIMIVELDVKDEKFKQQKRKITPTKGQ